MQKNINTNKTAIKRILISQVKTRTDLTAIKRKIAKEFKTSCPSNIKLLKAYHSLVRLKRIKRNKELESLLRTRKVRSLSGIVNVSVLTKPYPCPGKCIYCPNQKGIPKSYLSNEPAVMRAIINKFDPYLQVKTRIKALENAGHPTDKIELRVIGGTWSFYPKQYQSWFIKRCFDACNNKSARLGNKKAIQGLEKSQTKNEKAKHRIVGLSIETRPDFINEEEIKRLRKLGVTMVELGVQSIYNDVLKMNKRGHNIEATIKSTKLLKDAGFKICYQMMPNLLGSNPKKDKKMFEELFRSPNFQPDMLKIYPCALLKEAPLYRWWKAGKYKPYTSNQLINLIKSIKQKIPYYVRIQRIVRDIPSQSIVAGPAKISNLRQLIAQDMKKENWKCKCIRCREVREKYNPKEKIYLFRQDYEASGGKEIFLSFENKNRAKLYSLLRLRIPSYVFTKATTPRHRQIFPVLENSAIIRELHTYGQMLPIASNQKAPQHKGLGKKLIKTAERITKREFGLKRIAVISSIGVRQYYSSKLGYRLKESYMVKGL